MTLPIPEKIDTFPGYRPEEVTSDAYAASLRSMWYHSDSDENLMMSGVASDFAVFGSQGVPVVAWTLEDPVDGKYRMFVYKQVEVQ